MTIAGDDAGRADPRHRRVHVAGAGARQGGRQARRHLGLRRRALRDADGPAALQGRDGHRRARGGAARRHRLDSAAGRDAGAGAAPARTLSRSRRQERLQAIGEARVALEEATARAIAKGEAARTAAARPPIVARGRWLAAAVVVVAFAGALVLWQLGRTTKAANVPAPQAGRSIAVLPFVNSGGNTDDEYFADGMTDELIASLGKVPALHVAARSSAFSFKGQKIEVREVARKLGVDSVLEGTVRRSGKRLRVTASLVNAADGLQLWSSTFENEGGDAFTVQDEVTRGIVSGLSLQLAGTALLASQAGRTKDPEAHDLYLRGLALLNSGERSRPAARPAVPPAGERPRSRIRGRLCGHRLGTSVSGRRLRGAERGVSQSDGRRESRARAGQPTGRRAHSAGVRHDGGMGRSGDSRPGVQPRAGTRSEFRERTDVPRFLPVLHRPA